MINKDELNMSIFVVDDDSLNLRYLKAILSKEGFLNIEQFLSGEAMLARMQTQMPDIILLDIMMPGMSGYDVCRTIKTNPKWQHIPIIMITAASLQEEMEPLRLSFELGAMDYISKPFKTIELVMRVKSALRLEKQRQELEYALETVRRLEKLLPICSYCKKVRNDQNYWQEVEVYISDHTDTVFSHSICPDCYAKYVKPQLDEIKKK
ncbi:MAG TPA: response regulator [Candidatus Cloacimonadota bacterium]|nr:response regulator [Candidatus Cloacimonadota bacterium]HPT72659.1 response regulator [Candidatus Cloacimonadota bacterium]